MNSDKCVNDSGGNDARRARSESEISVHPASRHPPTRTAKVEFLYQVQILAPQSKRRAEGASEKKKITY